MRSALICVFFALFVHKDGSLATDEDFKPTPIPLNDWNGERGNEGKGVNADADAVMLNGTVGTEASPATVTPSPRYWEDALRHSVYLTLVRDKIDQLIAKGSVVSPDGKLDHSLKEIDDHDLWEKIKTAPFDRLRAEEPIFLGDITVMSKGRLLEQQDGLKFTEDESKEKCDEEKCMEGVKAYWSVKRVRQRDAETVPGKYHYELTFYVSSQTHKKQKKPQDNPVRTFTVREGTPVERPQYRIHEPIAPAPRPQRAIWVHKNIVPPPHHQGRKQEQGLDRLFSSWFSSEEEPPVKRYKQVYVPPLYPQRSKVGHAGAPTEQYHQKYPMPYPHKPQPGTTYKYSRPPLGPPPTSYSPNQHHYIDLEPIRHQNQYTIPQPDYNHLSSNIIKSTKPAVLPTPSISYAPTNLTMTMNHNSNVTENSTRDPEIQTAYNMYNKPKQPPTKLSYFPEHVRPPVFNAPPGVFVTMDKKPFKPMPPLKHMHSHKQNKHKPVDFRPSPQVLDVQFSDPDPMSDAFRPISMSYGGSNTSKTSELTNRDRHNKPNRKAKPPKKHDNITRPHRTTTSAPDIITADYEAIDEMHWAEVLGAFVKTTPTMSYKATASETTTFIQSSTDSSTTIKSSPSTTEVETVTVTTSKPRRTRPPPKFTKPLKAKKHKRVTSTTTSTTTTTTEKLHYRKQDLTPQATSGWQPKIKQQNESVPTTPMSPDNSVATSTPEPLTTTTKIIPTTYRALTTTPYKTSTAVVTDSTTAPTVATIQQKNKLNRFRQSTLMLKGTSVNHDKWSSPYQGDKNKTSVERTRSPISGKYPRRKGSNFIGYGAYTQKTVDERKRVDHVDHVYNPNDLNVISLISTSGPIPEVAPLTTPKPTEATYEKIVDQKEENELEEMSGTDDPDGSAYMDDADESDEAEEADEADEETSDEQQKKDNNEYIFDTSSGDSSKDSTGLDSAEKSNEVKPEIVTTTQKTVVTSPHSAVKNKTKCKKKKTNLNETLKSASEEENEVLVAPIATTTEKLSTADFFQQIFGLTTDPNETDDHQPESKYVDSDKDLEEFLESIHEKNETPDVRYDADYEVDRDDEKSPFNNDEDNKYARNVDSSEDYQDRPYSFLELLEME